MFDAIRTLLKAIFCLVILSLSAISFSGCNATWRWVRHGVGVDTLNTKINRLDSLYKHQNQLLTEMNADVLTELEQLRRDLAQVSAKIEDNQESMNRSYTRRSEILKTDSTNTKTALSVDPDEIYKTAYLDYTQGNYDIAISGFGRYLQLFPDTELSDNAQYWIGECYYTKKLYSDAILEFEKVITIYPQGNKVVSALYKIGLAYQSNNENTKAKQYFKRVFEEYPATPEANLARERYNSLP